MEFKFAKYTEITDLALEVNPEYKKAGYTRIFICPDVWDYWLVRILPNYNEEYEPEEGVHILERNKVEKLHRGEELTMRKLKAILIEDDFSNYDLETGHHIEDMITDMIDGGFGILNRKEVTQ
jgi:hypothetical protein